MSLGRDPSGTEHVTGLLLRVRSTSGPDRELDAEIARACGWRRGAGFLWTAPDGDRVVLLPRFTGSVDDAVALVPDDMEWSVGVGPQGPYANLAIKQGWASSGMAATPALALCLASLHALGRRSA